MRLFDLIERIKSMFSKSTYEQIAGTDVVLTSTMIKNIDLWNEMLKGTAPWNEQNPALGVAAGICREFADIAINEMTAECTNETLDKYLKACIRDLNENLQDGLALGSFIIKPYINGEKLEFEFVNADCFIPVKFAGNKLVDVMFIEHKEAGQNKHYFRIERHRIIGDSLEITNKAYFSSMASSIGQPCKLSDVSEWANMPEAIMYPVAIMPMGFYKNPLKNRIDGSGCGVSIYSQAIELIKKADIQGTRIDWEFESAERALHVDERALKHGVNNGGVYLPASKRKLYRGLNIDGKNEELFQEFSPALRQDGYLEGLESYLRQIEFVVGLAYGDLSDANYVDKTATEIKTAKQRKYNRVTAIQDNLKECLEDFVIACAFYLGMYNSGFETVINFSDSILTDEKEEREQDRQDVNMGVMSLVEYRAKWYGETPEEAEKNIPETTTVFEV